MSALQFIGRALEIWAEQNGITVHFIQPGKPVQNRFITRHIQPDRDPN
jgi:hypothetical protein